MPKKRTNRRKKISSIPGVFYTISLSPENNESTFNLEYNLLSKTIESVNNFNELYQAWRSGTKGGPASHAQQDLYRAMLVFACAGLDVFIKHLVKTKLPNLIGKDKECQKKFTDYIKGGLKKEDNILSTVALALIDPTPRNVFLDEYIESMTYDSLQSWEQIRRVSIASGLNIKQIFTPEKINALNDAFDVRNQIIHEMDINVSVPASRTTGYRTRRQRISRTMEKHTKTILDLAQELFTAFKDKFELFKIDIEKGS